MSAARLHIPSMTDARIGGGLYLMIIVCGLFAEIVVRGTLVVAGDATATAQNILANTGLFRIGVASDVIMIVADVAIAIVFYHLLKPISAPLAMMAAAFRLMQAAIISASVLVEYAALMVLGGAFDIGARDGVALLFMDIHSHGYDLGLIFFGASCLILGHLVYRAPYFPKALGALVMAAGVVYIAGSSVRFFAPAWVEVLQPAYIIPLVSEVALCLWLLIRGVGQAK